MSNDTLEQALAKEYLKKLQERLKIEIECVTGSVNPPEEYAQRVGYIRAIKESLEDFQSCLKAFFPTT